MQRELNTFSLSPLLRSKLVNSGFVVVEDVIGLKPSELSKELGIDAKEAVELLQLVRDSNEQRESAVTALDLLHSVHNQQPIITFSEQLDTLLGGGVPLGKMTEFSGAPGAGKTQMCMQLSVDVQIPVCFGGNGGQAVYIDTEGSFVVERLVDIAQATVKHCHFIASVQPHHENEASLKDFTVESVLSRVHCFRCHDHTQLIAVTRTLDTFLSQHPTVKLVVVDSIAFHFRQDFDDYLLRSRLLNALAQTFNMLAAKYNVAVVVTNQMTTLVGGGGDGAWQQVPSLGECWAHVPTQRVILYWRQQQRHAMIYKSAALDQTHVCFQITADGIRDVTDCTPDAVADRNTTVVTR